jgi:hypothetical protein
VYNTHNMKAAAATRPVNILILTATVASLDSCAAPPMTDRIAPPQIMATIQASRFEPNIDRPKGIEFTAWSF